MGRFFYEMTPETKKENIIIFNDVRISVLLPNLLRIEKQQFTDDATQIVINRDLAVNKFSIKQTKNTLSLTTEEVIFYIDLKKGVVLKVKFLKSGNVVKYNPKNNLLGTTRTLDMVNGDTHLDKGILSIDGLSMVDDSKSLLLKDEKVLPRQKCQDYYYFACEDSFEKVLYMFYSLTGFTPLIPKYALGNWWSRYKAYTQDEYLTLMKTFKQKRIPFTIATIDMDWHYVDVISKFGKEAKPQGTDNIVDKFYYSLRLPGWTGYTWNEELFPDYQKLLKELKAMNYHITLNIHPSQGIRFFERQYADFAENMGINPKSKQEIKFQVGNQKFWANYFDLLHHPYEKDGVSFWWIDWQQGKKSDVEGLDPLWALNHYHTVDMLSEKKRPLILSRYAGLGSHRYPIGFSGDSIISWASLNFQPYFTSTSSNAGYTWWSHDIGGHQRGIKDDELALRWLQLGVFSPINRLHSTSNEFMGKEPWKYQSYIERIMEKYLRLRQRLIPYIYSYNYLTHKYGRPLIEPLYYHEKYEDVMKYRNEYFFGNLLVMPITHRIDKKTGLAYEDVYIPDGTYTDIFNKRIYQGGYYTLARDLDNIIVLAKSGSIIPLYLDDDNSLNYQKGLEIKLFHGNSSFLFYDDEGDNLPDIDRKFVIVKMEQIESEGQILFSMTAEGNKELLSLERKIKITFEDVVKGKMQYEGKEYDLNSLIINYHGQDVKVVLKEYQVLENLPYREEAINIISRYQTSNHKKLKKYLPLVNDITKPIKKEKIDMIAIDELRKVKR